MGRLNAGGQRALAVGVSGGESSTTAALLLRQYHDSLNANPKIPPSRIVLVHVRMTGLDAAEPAASARDASGAADSPKIPEAVRAVRECLADCQVVVTCIEQPVVDCIVQVRDASDRAQLADNAMFAALARAAEATGCDTVVLGSSVNRAATDVLQSVISGRGTKVKPDATGAITVANVRVVKPLYGIPARLLVRYAHLRLPRVAFAQRWVPRRCLQHVVERFVGEVAADNASSVHNVVSVAERLVDNQGPLCAICAHVVACSPVHSPCSDPTACDCKPDVVLCDGCRGCANRFKEDEEKHNSVLKLASRQLMRKEIEDFLL